MRLMCFMSLLCLLVACHSGQENQGQAEPGPASLISSGLLLNWFPEMEHGGFYAAQVHGYFRDQGLEVSIQPGGPNTQVIPRVASKQVAFGIVSADEVLLALAQGAPVVAVMASMQNAPRCIMVHEKSGVARLEDLKSITLAADVSQPFYHFLRKRVALTGVTTVPYSGNVAEFLVKEDYAQQAYVISEPFVARSKGGDPKCLMTSDLGFNPYTSILITHPEVAAQQPDLVRKVVAASVKGWARYLENPDEANGLIHRLNPEMDLAALKYGAETIKPLVLDDVARKQGIGTMTLERWTQLSSQLEEAGLISTGVVHPEQAFTTAFLPASPR